VANVGFDFERLLYEALEREQELEDDDTEGDELESVLGSDLLSTSPFLDPPSSGQSHPVPQTAPGSPEPVHHIAHGHAASPFLDQPPPGQSRSMPKTSTGPTEAVRRKARGHAKRAIQRFREKQTMPYGEYCVKPKVLNTYIRPAKAIGTKLDAIKMKHSKHAYTGGKEEGAEKRLYELHELVGEGSQFGFKLEHWNGR
jgi:hypothetical protein